MKKHVPLILVLAVTAAGLIRIAMYNWREGTGLIAVALLLAALLRALLPGDRVGTVAIRSRPVDVLLYSGLGLMMMFVALTITGGPLDQ